MAALLSRLPSLPSRLQSADRVPDKVYDRQIRDYIVHLKQSLSKEASSISSADDSLLDNLDPSVHSISYLFILQCQVRSDRKRAGDQPPQSVRPGGRLWPKTARFLHNFDPIQVRYVGQEWRELVEITAQAAQVDSKPLLAVPLIKTAILRLDPSGATFTSTHVLFTKLCLHSKAYTHALPVLDKYICRLPPGSEQGYLKHAQPLRCEPHGSSAAFITSASGLSSKLGHKDYQQYFLYGGMIYLVLKEWDKALHFLSIVIASPAINSVSTIMVEAYKKWILASLLKNGELSAPGLITPHVMRVYRSLTRPYIALANAFKAGDFQRLTSEVELGSPIWDLDNNTGLVSQVVHAFHKHTLIRLGRSFAALTMEDVKRSIPHYKGSVDDMESFVASLIMSGDLNAALLHSGDPHNPTMLHFSSVTSQSPILQDAQVQSRLGDGIRLLKTITNTITETNHALELNDDHIDHLRRSQRRNDPHKGRASIADGSGSFGIDEDIMGDMS